MKNLIMASFAVILLNVPVRVEAQFGSRAPPPATLTMQSVIILEQAVRSYQPFTISARFSTPYCINTSPDGFADVTLSGGVLNVQLSHLSAKGCTTVGSKDVSIPGLPAGTYQVRIAVTARDGVAFLPPISNVEVDAYEAEAGQVALTVAARDGESRLSTCTALRTSGVNANQPAVQLMTFDTCFSIGATVAAVEIGTFIGKRIGTFSAFRFVAAAPPLPFVPLYLLTYPTGFAGTYATTSAATCNQLAAAWANPASSCTTPVAYVLQAKSGACPLGSSPVWQLFQTNPIAHRYTQIATTYSMLVNAGNVGEGVVWCAPVRE